MSFPEKGNILWRETDRAFRKGNGMVIGCPRQNKESLGNPFCPGYAWVEIEEVSSCPKCGLLLSATEDARGRWRGMVPVTELA